MPPESRRLAAIMFTDVVGFTALMAESEERGLRVRERHRALVGPLVRRYGGDSIEIRGDECLSVFASALDAVNCALAIHAGAAGEPDLALHVGIHLGDVVIAAGEASGDGVNIASRLLSLSEGGGVLVSGEVHNAVRNQPGIEATPLGEHDFRNVGRPVDVHRLTGSPSAPRATAQLPTPRRRAGLSVAAIAALAALAALGVWYWQAPPGSTGEIRTLAVLPFENLSDDPEQEYFTDGMTDALIADLAKIGSLRVISRTSTMQYKRTQKPIPEIARDLGVDGIIEGSVLRAGDSVRITVQLIDARTDHHLWSENYRRDLSDVLALQGQVARAIAREIELELSSSEQARLASAARVNPEAHEAYLKGRYFQHRETADGGRKAVQYFERSIRLDPGYALPYAGLADTLSCTPTHAWSSDGSSFFPAEPARVIAKARFNALKALELDDMLAEAHLSVALVEAFGDWDWESAEAKMRYAIELDRSYWWAYQAHGLVLSVMGRFDDALAQVQAAVALAPLDSRTTIALGEVYAWRGEPQKAIAQWEKALELEPMYPKLHQSLGLTLCSEGMPEKTVGPLEQARGLFPDDPLIIADLAYCYAASGRRGDAERLLNELEELSKRSYVSPVSFALVHVGLGRVEETFEWLEKGYAERALLLPFISLDSPYEPLRSDPRFADLLRRMGVSATGLLAQARTSPVPG